MSKTILFCHPGGEHVPRCREAEGTVYPWNTGGHHRKFMLVRAATAMWDRSAAQSTGTHEVGLWGEWEPPSLTGIFHGDDRAMLPQAWHRPLFDATDNPPPCAQNTDPWIFGERMRYAICRQARHELLRRLESGDVVFFGSLRKRDECGHRAPEFNFFLDTVFVVRCGQPYWKSALPQNVDDLYRRATLDRIRGQIPDRGLVLYEGAMLDDPAEGMFSFVPCKPAKSDTDAVRFARPMINDLWPETSCLGKQSQLAYREVHVSPSEAWAAVADHCRSLGLEMAVRVHADPRQATQRDEPQPTAA
ncbi:MAG: hypothetical protein KGK07_01870 [Chloroflexota bacterium]|nr:hypothetical protein [Chloroflexota bacterium]